MRDHYTSDITCSSASYDCSENAMLLDWIKTRKARTQSHRNRAGGYSLSTIEVFHCKRDVKESSDDSGKDGSDLHPKSRSMGRNTGRRLKRSSMNYLQRPQSGSMIWWDWVWRSDSNTSGKALDHVANEGEGESIPRKSKVRFEIQFPPNPLFNYSQRIK